MMTCSDGPALESNLAAAVRTRKALIHGTHSTRGAAGRPAKYVLRDIVAAWIMLRCKVFLVREALHLSTAQNL